MRRHLLRGEAQSGRHGRLHVGGRRSGGDRPCPHPSGRGRFACGDDSPGTHRNSPRLNPQPVTSVLRGTYLWLERSGHDTFLNSGSGQRLAIVRHQWGTGGALANQANVSGTRFRRQLRRSLAGDDLSELEHVFGKNYVDWTLRKKASLSRQGQLRIRCADWKHSGAHGPALRVIGRNLNGRANVHMRLHDGRWLRLRVQGMQPNHAMMSAVALDGDPLIGYRFAQGSSWTPRHVAFRQSNATIEVVVSPSLTMCPEPLLLVATSAREFRGFFIRPRGGV
jgi:hypothetical protein